MNDMATRRAFLKDSAVLATAMALGAEMHIGAEETPKTVRVGLVGVGNRGTALLGTLLSLPGVEVPAICDINEANAKRAQGMVEGKRGKLPELYTKDERDWENLCKRDDLDAVITATPWQWHTPVMLAAMRAGKYGGTEVPAALTLEECWALVKTSEETGKPCMMLENVCYFENVLAVMRMVREGVLGEMLHFEAGYQHECRSYYITDSGELTWRGQHLAEKNGNLYPTHPIGPIAWWGNVNRGDRFVSLSSISTKSRGMRNYAAEKLGPEHPLAKRDYAMGDVNTTLLRTEKGLTVTLYFDMCTPRPYDLIFRVQGTKGLCMVSNDKAYIEGMSPEKDKWEPFEPYVKKYAHPLWTDLETEAVKNGGHGGGDYIVVQQFIEAVRKGAQTPQDVYDAATWSAIVPLSMDSVAKNGGLVEFPDFTKGKWETNAPIPIHGA
jgi:predicted dehydrogenase